MKKTKAKKPTHKSTADKLAIELKRAEMIAAGLEDRLMLALDGKRPPKGLLSTLEALKPFAETAKKIVQWADANHYADDICLRLATDARFRDALNTYNYFTKGVVPKGSKTRSKPRARATRVADAIGTVHPSDCHYGAGPHTRKP